MSRPYPITLYDPRSGLHRDTDIPTWAPTVIVQQIDDEYVYFREFDFEQRLPNGRDLYRYARTKKDKYA